MRDDRADRRPLMDEDDWAALQMPVFERVMTPHLDFTKRVGPHAPHQYYSSDVTQNAFAGWLACVRSLVPAGVVDSRGSYPSAQLNAAGRQLPHATVLFSMRRLK